MHGDDASNLKTYAATLAKLRAKLVDGDWQPGEKIPTQRELCRELGTSAGMVQRAMQALTRDGFFETQGNAGTRVAKHPPHIDHYALALPYLTSGPFVPVSRFMDILDMQAHRWSQYQPGKRMTVYRGVDGHSDSEDYSRLVADVQNHRVAGVIYGGPPNVLAGHSLVEHPTVPTVTISAPFAAPRLPSIYPDHRIFIDRAVQHLMSRGCRRIAMLCKSGSHSPNFLVEICQARGAITRKYWSLYSEGNALDTTVAAQVLFHLAEPPDSLILADDNIVTAATKGLAEMGSPLPRDLPIVAHCNWPTPPITALPVTWLGFDAPTVLHACTSAIDLMRQGQTPQPHTRISPRFEDETAHLFRVQPVGNELEVR